MILSTQISQGDPAAQASATAMHALVEDLRAKLAVIEQGGGKRARDKHKARGKLTPRERIVMLLDPGSAFLELSPLAAYEVYDEAVPAAGIVTGIARSAGASA